MLLGLPRPSVATFLLRDQSFFEEAIFECEISSKSIKSRIKKSPLRTFPGFNKIEHIRSGKLSLRFSVGIEVKKCRPIFPEFGICNIR